MWQEGQLNLQSLQKQVLTNKHFFKVNIFFHNQFIHLNRLSMDSSECRVHILLDQSTREKRIYIYIFFSVRDKNCGNGKRNEKWDVIILVYTKKDKTVKTCLHIFLTTFWTVIERKCEAINRFI